MHRNKLRVGVFGDSFADRKMDPKFMYDGRRDESWMQTLEDLGCSVETYGLGGASSWFAYEKFLALHKYFQAIVFVMSHPNRIHSMPEEFSRYSTCQDHTTLYNSPSFLKLDEVTQNRIVELVKAHTLVRNPVLDNFIVKNIYNDVNSICREKNIKLVTLMPFENKKTIEKYNTRNAYGDCLYNLMPVVYRELEVFPTDPRYCHLTEENNSILGNVIFKSFKDRPPRMIDLESEINFVFHPQITERYQRMLRS